MPTQPLPPLPVTSPVAPDTSPIITTPPRGTDLDPIWERVVPETRSRANDIHLPISLAYAERLCDCFPEADALMVRVALLLHDTGWGRVDETRIISEGFRGDWRKADIRFEHERQSCLIAEEVLPDLGYSADFIAEVNKIIDGHDTRPDALSLEDALVRDADRLWRFTTTGIALASGWFDMAPSPYTDRLVREIIPELKTQPAIEMATAELERATAMLKTAVLR
ncbi:MULTISPECIES: HD domain-containing protein [unclassified Luteococcus]|uniref:HD domain-containing protein n=1 Tax=unclassified Luteococcus TaxID=2639923 RepID=UPI00313D295B